MHYINYQALVNVMRTQKPYRGSTNRYPLANRKQSHKYFLHEKDADGNDFMRIIYGNRYESTPITKEIYDSMPEQGEGYSLHKYADGYHIRYVKYDRVLNELGIVRPDNTFEFTGKSYRQGEMMLMSDFGNYGGYFKTDCKRGGMLYVKYSYKERQDEQVMPIFKGLRVDCDTMKPIPNHTYKLIGRRVNRKSSKEFLKQYEEFFKVSEAMMKVMPFSTFLSIAKDKLIEQNAYSDQKYFRYSVNTDRALADAKALMKDSPIDAAALFCACLDGRGVGNFVWLLRHDSMVSTESTAEGLFIGMKRGVCNMLYRENPEILTEVEFEYGKPFPQSSWDYVIEVDGNVVEQY